MIFDICYVGSDCAVSGEVMNGDKCNAFVFYCFNRFLQYFHGFSRLLVSSTGYLIMEDLSIFFLYRDLISMWTIYISVFPEPPTSYRNV